MEEMKKRAQMNSVGRILTDEEHQKIRAAKALKHVTYGRSIF